MPTWAIVLIIVALVVVIVGLITFLTSYVKAGPDEAIMISGSGKKKILIGKAGFRVPFFQRMTCFINKEYIAQAHISAVTD